MQTGDPSPSPRLLARLQRLTRVFVHPLWLIALLVPASLAFAAHLWLPQAPTALGADAVARSAWQNATAASLPGGVLLDVLGLLDLAHSPGWRILLALLAATLVLRLSDALLLAWATRRLAPPHGWLPRLSLVERLHLSPADPALWKPSCARLFGRWRDAPTTTAVENDDEAYGDHNHRFTWAAALIEAGMLLALLALALNLRSGWQIDALSLDPGQNASLAPFSAETIRLNETGATLEVCCRRPTSAPLTDSLRLATPGLRLRVQQLGPALAISAQANGQAAPLQAVEQSGAPSSLLLLRFPGERSERAVALPDRNLFLRLVALPEGRFSVQALDAANNVLITQSITADVSLAVGDVSLQLRPSHYAVVSVSARRWQWLLIPAILLALAGLLLRWRFPYVRAGVRQNEGGATVRWQGQRGGRPTPDDILSALAAPGPDQPK